LEVGPGENCGLLLHETGAIDISFPTIPTCLLFLPVI
jgi:hypothetical protein